MRSSGIPDAVAEISGAPAAVVGAPVAFFCDGSISPAAMVDPLHSRLSSENVGRVIVLAPALDRGFVARVKDGILTSRGTPDSANVEFLAIQSAIACAARWGVSEYAVVCDCQGAVDRAADERVRWECRRSNHLPNSFFDRVLRRGSYIRSSEGKVKARRQVTPAQQEIFELLGTEMREFRLSESQLWAEIQKRLLQSARS